MVRKLHATEKEEDIDYYVIEKYLEQSTLAETVKGKLMPQIPGRAAAAPAFVPTFWAVALMQLHAVFLSAGVEAADASLEAPAQQAVDGDPLPVARYWIQGLRSVTTSLQVSAPPGTGRRRTTRINTAETARVEDFMVRRVFET